MKQRIVLLTSVALLSTAHAGIAQSPAPAAAPAVAPLPWLSPSVEGQPIETRPPNKADNAPVFPEQTRAPYRPTAPFKVTTLIDDLEAPWGMGFLPSGSIILTERLPGRIRILKPNGELSGPVTGVQDIAAADGTALGLLDIVVDPNYATNQRIFFSYFDVVDGTNTNTQIARARLDEATGTLTEVKVIFRAEPRIPSRRLGAKTGGRLAIGPDGTLYFPIGDRSDSPPWLVAQEMNTHLGKILRIDADGNAPADNPFVGQPGALPEIWATGTRSQEGLAFDPRTGRLWENEHGSRGGDELNIIEKGKNYGWPLVSHGVDYPGTPIGDGANFKEGLEEPVYYWDPIVAPSGLAFYQGDLFPEWKNSIFVGGLAGKVLLRLELKDDKVVGEEPMLTEVNMRIRDVRVGPDGAVYVLTDSGGTSIRPGTPPISKLLKLTPQ